MVKECARAKMKPVCNQGSYCKSDKNSIYLGNPSHALSYRPYVSSTSYRSRFPQGFAGPSSKPKLRTALISTRILGKTMRDAARNKERCEGRLPNIQVLIISAQRSILVSAAPALNATGACLVTLSRR